MSGYQVLEDGGGTKARHSKESPGGTQTRRQQLAWAFLLLLGSAIFVIFYSTPRLSSKTLSDETVLSGGELRQCASGLPPAANPPATNNLWAPLSSGEIVEIIEWLEAPARGLNITRGDNAQLGDNMVFLVEAYRPSKASALRYLDNPTPNNLPSRYSRVTIHHGAELDPFIMDYLVGPLPISSVTKMKPLTEIYHRERIPFNARGYTAQVGIELVPLLSKIMTPLANVTKVRCLK